MGSTIKRVRIRGSIWKKKTSMAIGSAIVSKRTQKFVLTYTSNGTRKVYPSWQKAVEDGWSRSRAVS